MGKSQPEPTMPKVNRPSLAAMFSTSRATTFAVVAASGGAPRASAIALEVWEPSGSAEHGL